MLASLVVVALGGAAWLFALEGRQSSEPDPTPGTSTPAKPRAKGVLDVADEKHAPKSRRGTSTTPDDEQAAERPADPSLPSTFAHLRGRSVAIAPASAAAAAVDAPRVRIAGLRLPCATGTDETRLRRELAAIAELRALLERAGASVSVLIDERGRVTCVDERARALAAADFALVVRAGDATSGRVLPARAAAADDESRQAATALAAEIAAALDLDAITPGTSKADRSLLAGVGALALEADEATALVELPPMSGPDTDADAARLREHAMAVVTGIAARASAASR